MILTLCLCKGPTTKQSLRGAAGDAAIQRGGAPDCRLPRFVRR
jgi:hypothetical protein